MGLGRFESAGTETATTTMLWTSRAVPSLNSAPGYRPLWISP